MTLRDHFHPPLDDLRHWEGFHATWPVMICAQLYSAACRMTKLDNEWQLEAWMQSLELGQPLPTVPLWLADDLAVPLELNESYEQSCGILNIP